VIALPLYVVFQGIGLLDTHAALILTYVATNLPIAIWLLRDVFATIPIDIEEAAMIEGASRVRILISIVLPLAASGLATTFLFLTILCWNEYLFAVTLSADEAQTMPAFLAGQMAVREQMASSEPQWGYFSVVILIMVAPLISLAWLLQRLVARRLMESLSRGPV
jgi:multiple sugar transport system permease protein